MLQWVWPVPLFLVGWFAPESKSLLHLIRDRRQAETRSILPGSSRSNGRSRKDTPSSRSSWPLFGFDDQAANRTDDSYERTRKD
jgi:hypothetical protein